LETSSIQADRLSWGGLVAFLRGRRAPWIGLGIAILASAWLTLYATSGQGFAVDELFYYGRVAAKDGGLLHFSQPFDPEYLLAPFNGHLALGGRLVYETVFAAIGAKYTAFVLIDVLGMAACSILLFALIRRRVGDLAALAPCILLLFLGFAREQFVWPIDFNSAWALAAGLGAVLCLQRRRGLRDDLLACLLLTISAALIEVGLAFAAGIAVMVLIGPDRWRRAWIFLVPVALYGAWYLWATPIFGAGEGAHLSNLQLIPKAFMHGLGGTLGALTGTNQVVPGSTGGELTWFGRGLAIAALLALALRIRRGSLPRTIWVWLTALSVYWLLLAFAARTPESSRYLLVTGTLVVLIAADSVRRPLSNRASAVLFVLVALALPANIDQLLNGRDQDTFHVDAVTSRIDFGMLDLARGHVDPTYVVSADPAVAEAGGGLMLGLPAGAYLQSAEQNGSIGYSLAQVRGLPEEKRQTADAALARALGLELLPAEPPGAGAGCRAVAATGDAPGAFELPFGRSLFYVPKGPPVLISVRRFAAEGAGFSLATLQSGYWASIGIPRDAAPEHWQAMVTGPIRTCFGRWRPAVSAAQRSRLANNAAAAARTPNV
jgi:hypothetical protein